MKGETEGKVSDLCDLVDNDTEEQEKFENVRPKGNGITVIGPRGEAETVEEYKSRFTRGCACCEKRLDPVKRHTYSFLSEDVKLNDGTIEERDYPLCMHCAPLFKGTDNPSKFLGVGTPIQESEGRNIIHLPSLVKSPLERLKEIKE
jgi:hypothetical protein